MATVLGRKDRVFGQAIDIHKVHGRPVRDAGYFTGARESQLMRLYSGACSAARQPACESQIQS